MRGNLIYENIIGNGSKVKFVEDENGEYEVVDGGRITQRQNNYSTAQEQLRKSKCDVCGEPSTHFTYSGIKGNMSFCCKHHIERGGIPSDWHPQCLKYYKEKIEPPQAKQSQPEDNPEYVITAFRNKNVHGCKWKLKSDGGYYSDNWIRLDYDVLISSIDLEIESVKRNSDNEEFTVDEITDQGKIIEFNAADVPFNVHCSHGYYKLSELTKKKEEPYMDEKLFSVNDIIENSIKVTLTDKNDHVYISKSQLISIAKEKMKS